MVLVVMYMSYISHFNRDIAQLGLWQFVRGPGGSADQLERVDLGASSDVRGRWTACFADCNAFWRILCAITCCNKNPLNHCHHEALALIRLPRYLTSQEPTIVDLVKDKSWTLKQTSTPKTSMVLAWWRSLGGLRWCRAFQGAVPTPSLVVLWGDIQATRF